MMPFGPNGIPDQRSNHGKRKNLFQTQAGHGYRPASVSTEKGPANYEEAAVKSWKRTLLILTVPVPFLIALVLVLAYFLNDFLVNFWWFKALGYDQYFWLRLIYNYAVFIAVTLLFFISLFLHFWIASKYLGAKTPSSQQTSYGSRTRYRRVYERFQRRSLMFYLPLTLVLAIVVALPLLSQWESALLYFFSRNTGVTDPIFGKDISYYLFELPVYIMLFRGLLIASVIVLLALILLYSLESRMVSGPEGRLRRGAKIHLNLAMLFVVLIASWYFILERHLLLYTDHHMPIFYGPGYVEMTFILPMIWVCLGLLLVFAAFFIYFVNTKKGLIGLVTIAVLFFGTLGFRYSPHVPEVLQKYVVKPNELALQSPYISHNIQSTLTAYDLQDVERREYPIGRVPWDMSAPEVQLSMQNIPIWDEVGLRKVFEELQEIRSYYAFPSIDLDRYTIDGFYQQVSVSAREIDLNNLPIGARSWVNEWLKYTHGYGAVMTPTAQRAAGPMEWFLQGIPPYSDHDISIKEPAIYFGAGDYSPAIAPNDSRELNYASDDAVELTDYRGGGGVDISNIFRRLVFAVYFNEINVLFTDQTNENSRILFRRNIAERISALTPFLLLDPHPYAVVTPERVYWIQDAYTFSPWYPYARSSVGHFGDHTDHDFNYIRNSVKVIVDAYDGTVDYYISDRNDPIMQTFSRAYPGLFKSFERMPEQLQRHVRYPKLLFNTQMELYGIYQQQDPEVFYKQEDMWVFPEVQWRDEVQLITSYYLTLNLFERERFEFSLLAPMNPKGKNNMRALAVVGCDGENYGRIITYSFPRGTLVYGPAQADTFVKQDPVISQQLTLWDQIGSEAHRGRLVVMPIDGAIAYIQGVFLQATTGASIPELVRIILNVGDRVVMESSIEEAFSALNARVQADRSRPARAQQGLRSLGAPPEMPSADVPAD
jgi:uncharacterized protein